MAGFLIVTLRWLMRWSRLRALLREAVAVQVDAPIAVKFSASLLEPGLAGILRPVILLPQGIEQQLSAVELKAVLAHELCHWRRHDNLLASIHMLVEALFWFFPLVWWLGARLNDERERACDESVLAEGNDPQEYAEGILKVCRAYLQSPLACVAGVSGGGLKKRIDAIMENRLIPPLNAVRKLVLSASAAFVLAVPLALGLATVPVAQIQAKAAPIPSPPLIDQRNANDTITTSGDAPLTERNRNNMPSQGTTSVPHSQIETATNGQTETLMLPIPDLSGLLPNESLPTPTVVASHEARAATATDQPAASAQAPAPGLVQASLANPTPAKPGSHEPPTAYTCRNTKVFGRVISSEAIQMQGFRCFLRSREAGEVRYGSCPLLSTAGPSFISTGTRLRQAEDDALSRGRGSCPFDVTMNVKLADPAEASKMQPGKMLSLAGDFRVTTEHRIVYLTVTNAKVIWFDPFDRPWRPHQSNSGGLEIEAFYNGALAPPLNIPSPTYR